MGSAGPWCEGCEIYPVSNFLTAAQGELSPTTWRQVASMQELIMREACPRVLDLRDEPERPAHCDYPHEVDAKVVFRGALHMLAMQRNGGDEAPNIAPLVAAAKLG